MGDLILQLIPLVLGIALSPLAIMALVAILVSPRARANGVAFLIGWSVGAVGVPLLGLWLFSVLAVHELQDPPLWVAVLRILVGLLLIAAAVWTYRRGRAHVRAMAAATTPQEVARLLRSCPAGSRPSRPSGPDAPRSSARGSSSSTRWTPPAR